MTRRVPCPGAVALVALMGACSDPDDLARDSEPFETPAGLQQAIQIPIIDCQTSAATCHLGASDVTGALACDQALAQCLQNAALNGQSITQQVDTCRQEGLSCLQASGDPLACQASYATCTQDVLLGGNLSDAGTALPNLTLDAGSNLPSLPSSAGLPSTGALPSLPSSVAFPSFGSDAGLSQLPFPLKCTVGLQLCVAGSPLSAMQCADDARTCLQSP